jgi:hypothetical protein
MYLGLGLIIFFAASHVGSRLTSQFSHLVTPESMLFFSKIAGWSWQVEQRHSSDWSVLWRTSWLL